MSRAELKKVVVVEKIISGQMTNAEGAAALGPSEYVLGKHEFLRVRVCTEQVRRRVVLQSGTNGQHGADEEKSSAAKSN
ncbi:hypothetical protein [Cohnella boryungensis]|uniref:Uncharacterized protein n=1 Tax=Cohnella boryungensis TaxID=768479 RepID=A0ABV8SJ69_9BACL